VIIITHMNIPKAKDRSSNVFVANPFRWDDEDIMQPVYEIKSMPIRRKQPSLHPIKPAADSKSRQTPEPRKKTES
jgi:hypothetical protein